MERRTDAARLTQARQGLASHPHRSRKRRYARPTATIVREAPFDVWFEPVGRDRADDAPHEHIGTLPRLDAKQSVARHLRAFDSDEEQVHRIQVMCLVEDSHI